VPLHAQETLPFLSQETTLPAQDTPPVSSSSGFSSDDPLGDPYVDSQAANRVISSNVAAAAPRKKITTQAAMLGLSYGLNPIIVFAPGISLAYYYSPVIVGVELSDSERFPAFTKERIDIFGRSQFIGNTGFVKVFIGESFYLMGAVENRTTNLWNRTYNRTWGGQAKYNVFIHSTVATLGIGALKFSDKVFLSFDFIRYGTVLSESSETEMIYETWSDIGQKGTMDNEITGRRDRWYDTLDSPSAMMLTVGMYF